MRRAFLSASPRFCSSFSRLRCLSSRRSLSSSESLPEKSETSSHMTLGRICEARCCSKLTDSSSSLPTARGRRGCTFEYFFCGRGGRVLLYSTSPSCSICPSDFLMVSGVSSLPSVRLRWSVRSFRAFFSCLRFRSAFSLLNTTSNWEAATSSARRH